MSATQFASMRSILETLGPPTAHDWITLDYHLTGCSRRGVTDGRSCAWCDATLGTPAVRRMIDLHADIEQLIATPMASVPYVTAGARCVTLASQVNEPGLRAPALRAVADQLLASVTSLSARLTGILNDLAAGDGILAEQCRTTAARTTITAIQQTPQLPWPSLLGGGLHNRIAELENDLSPVVQGHMLDAQIRSLGNGKPPPLRTQPEWAELTTTASDATSSVTFSQLEASGFAAGSLERLVLESILEEHNARVDSLASELQQISGCATIGRSAHEQQLASHTRRLIWRRTRIDWLLTLLDTGAASSLPAGAADRRGQQHAVTVPWYVAVAVGHSERTGYRSAIYNDAPTMTAADRLIQDILGAADDR